MGGKARAAAARTLVKLCRVKRGGRTTIPVSGRLAASGGFVGDGPIYETSLPHYHTPNVCALCSASEGSNGYLFKYRHSVLFPSSLQPSKGIL